MFFRLYPSPIILLITLKGALKGLVGRCGIRLWVGPRFSLGGDSVKIQSTIYKQRTKKEKESTREARRLPIGTASHKAEQKGTNKSEMRVVSKARDELTFEFTERRRRSRLVMVCRQFADLFHALSTAYDHKMITK